MNWTDMSPEVRKSGSPEVARDQHAQTLDAIPPTPKTLRRSRRLSAVISPLSTNLSTQCGRDFRTSGLPDLRTHQNDFRTQRAFTLIEVLVAIVMLAVVLPVALAGISACMRVASTVRDQDIALRVAQSRLAQLVAEDSWNNAGKTGPCDAAIDGEDAVGFRWEINVTPWRDPYCSVLTVSVLYGDPRDPRRVSLETIVVPPDSESTP